MSLVQRLAAAFRRDAEVTDAAGWALNLAIFRIVYLTAGVLPLAVDTFWWTRSALPGLHPTLWEPVSFFRWLPLAVVSDPTLGQALAVLLIALVVLGAVGYRTSLVLWLATAAAVFVLGIPQNQGKVHHYHNTVWFLAILAASPCAAVLSLDALRRRAAGRPSSAAPPGALTTLRYVWALMAVLYLFPGLAKLVGVLTGGWASAESQRLILWNKWLQLEWYEPVIRPVIRPDTLPDPILAGGATVVVVAEICVGLAMLFRRTRPIALAVGLGFHLSTGLVMGIFFSWLTPAYVALVDWSALARWRRGDGAVEPPRIEPSASSRPAVHVVGVALIALELAVGAAQLLTEIPHRYLPMRSRLVPLITSDHMRVLVWPFDAYPFFTSDGPREFSVLEFRLVSADGRERRVGPGTFAAAVGRPSASQVLTRRLARLEDPVARETAARHLAHALWRQLTPEERRNAQGLRIYASRIRVAATPEPMERALLLDIPASALDTMRLANRE